MGKKYLRTALVAMVVCLCASGCKAFRNAWDRITGPKRVEFGSRDEDTYNPYEEEARIGPGMLLSIQVTAPSCKPTVMEVQVDDKGEITLPYCLEKPVQCNRLTLEALRQKLVAEYGEYFTQPIVTVYFITKGSGVSPYGTILVMGEVMRPGPINLPATRNVTLTKALSDAGLKPFADQSAIQVIRTDKDGNKNCRIVNLYDIGKKGELDKDIALRAGDVVWVKQTWY